MPRRRVMIIALSCLLCGTGCAARRDFAVFRFWADWNTLAAPAVYCETRSHRPPSPVRVETYRWMYGEGPGPVWPAETVVVVQPSPAPSDEHWPEGDFEGSPPATRSAPRLMPPDSSSPIPPAPAARPDDSFFDGEGGLFEEFETPVPLPPSTSRLPGGTSSAR
ncbi:MAG: hypothetical protein WD066_07065 [Planctomycetaceae bacterium]